jgi:hypothetical protein
LQFVDKCENFPFCRSSLVLGVGGTGYIREYAESEVPFKVL